MAAMTWIETLRDATDKVFDTAWDVRSGTVIPDTSTVALKDGAVKVDATFLYGDLAGSSTLAKMCPWTTTAKVIRAYLDCSTRLIRAWGGEIRSFDGDRVMGVFMGDSKNTNATNCAREIDYTVEKIIGPKATSAFKSIKDNDIKIRHAVGIDTGDARAVRAGIRNSNDLIWIGRPPSLAAKLSDIRAYPYAVYISKECYNRLGTAGKIVHGTNIWEAVTHSYAGEQITVYRTKYMKTP